MKSLRQGDVLLIPMTDEAFADECASFEKSKFKTVALGEATGHHHTFKGDVEVYEEKSDLAINARGILVDVRGESVLTHQEHGAIAVPKGKYRRIISAEYQPEAIATVID